MIGLCGPHRSGKTTLAREYAKNSDAKFLETRASVVFKDMGLDPAKTYDFSTRMDVQEEILKRFEADYRKQIGGMSIITDRTPLDLLAYTLAEAVADNVEGQNEERLERYSYNCFRVLNNYFSIVMLVQPGLPLVAENGKAALNKAYQEHLNAIILGLMVGEKTNVPAFFIPRSNLDLGERLDLLQRCIGRTVGRVQEEIQALSSYLPIAIH